MKIYPTQQNFTHKTSINKASKKVADRMTLVASEDDVSWFLRKNTKHTDIKDLKKRIPNLLV